MPPHSTLARIGQCVVAGLAVLSCAWLARTWDASPAWAVLGVIAIVFCYAPVMAVQVMLVHHVSRSDTAPRPSASELLRAWWGEVCLVPPVFYWRLPFRWRRWPDQLGAEVHGRRGVVFLHGFICNRGFWWPWVERMQGRGFVALNLEPVFGSIDDYAGIIDDAVKKVTEATGLPPVLLCHSMGGLAARAWLRRYPDASRVHHIITIGSPHHGTWLGRFSHTPNGRQMRLAGDWLQELARDEAQRRLPPFTCWYSHCDNIVFPTSSATLPHADNRLVRGPAHVELAFVDEVIDGSLELLDTA